MDLDEEDEEAASRIEEGLGQLASLVRSLVSWHGKDCPPALSSALESLHAALLHLEPWPAVQEDIAAACQQLYLATGSPAVIAQSIPYWLLRALGPNCRPADLRACYQLREALTLFDYDDGSIEDLKRLMLRAAFAPQFLRSGDGRRFLSYLFGLQPALTAELGAIVKNQLPSARRAVLQSYADVLFRAWSQDTAGSGACQLALETEVLEPIARAAVLSARPALASAARAVLGQFHGNKRRREVEALLARLYHPLLLSSLRAPNALARRNALLLLGEAYPVQDLALPAAELTAMLEEQHEALLALLADDCPEVRATAAGVAAALLGRLWDALPTSLTAQALKRLAEELALDSSSPLVSERAAAPPRPPPGVQPAHDCLQCRSAALDALSALVDHPPARPAVKKAARRLGPLLYDKSRRVSWVPCRPSRRSRGRCSPRLSLSLSSPGPGGAGTAARQAVPAAGLPAVGADLGRGGGDGGGPR